MLRDQFINRIFGVPALDIAARDKIPVIRELMAATGEGIALDIGSGTGYTTYSVFGNRPTVCVDLYEPNLRYHKSRIASIINSRGPICIVAAAAALPFRENVFQFILCSEVLEHLKMDAVAVEEVARVLANQGTAVITVPCIGLALPRFHQIFRIRSVHDFLGPEHHERPGYDERSLEKLLSSQGLEVVRLSYFLRFFTRLATEFVSLCHMFYESAVHKRRAWTWSDVTKIEGGPVFQVYAVIFPFLWAWCRLDCLLNRFRGFGLVVAVRKMKIERSGHALSKKLAKRPQI